MHETAPRTDTVHLRLPPPGTRSGTEGTGSTRAAFRGGVRWIRRTAAHAALGLPLTLAAVPMALCGLGDTAARAQRARARRFGSCGGTVPPADPSARTVRTSRTGGRIGAGRVLRHSLLTLLPALISFVAVMMSAFGVYSGYLYFLRPDAVSALGHPLTADHQFDNSWGGPTLVGAWSVHSLAILGIHVLALPLMRGLGALQDRATRRLLTP